MTSPPVAQTAPPLASPWLRLAVRVVLAIGGYALVVIPVLLSGTTYGIVEALVVLLLAGIVRAVLAGFLARAGRHNGQSLSKQVTGMRVVDESGLPITYGKAFAREAAWPFLVGALSLVLIGILLALADGIAALVDDQRRRLVDRVLGTRVVVADPMPYWLPDVARGGDAQATHTASASAAHAAFHPDGWYPDPVSPGTLRYWSAGAWTGHTHRA